MSKSLYKLPFIGHEMLIKCFRKKKKNITFYQRNTTIPFCFVNKEFEIHQGVRFKSYTYRYKQLGLKLGEFAKTRATSRHKGKRLKITKKRTKMQKTFFSYDLKHDFFTR